MVNAAGGTLLVPFYKVPLEGTAHGMEIRCTITLNVHGVHL
jgi:hypothetical protein